MNFILSSLTQVSFHGISGHPREKPKVLPMCPEPGVTHQSIWAVLHTRVGSDPFSVAPYGVKIQA